MQFYRLFMFAHFWSYNGSSKPYKVEVLLCPKLQHFCLFRQNCCHPSKTSTFLPVLSKLLQSVQNFNIFACSIKIVAIRPKLQKFCLFCQNYCHPSKTSTFLPVLSKKPIKSKSCCVQNFNIFACSVKIVAIHPKLQNFCLFCQKCCHPSKTSNFLPVPSKLLPSVQNILFQIGQPPHCCRAKNLPHRELRIFLYDLELLYHY